MRISPTLRPSWPLAPFVPMYGAGVVARRWLYDTGRLAAHPPPRPTICVGGLEAGGSGKTPVAAWLLDWLCKHGHRPGLLTRGYGRSRSAPSLIVRQPGEKASPARLGDEAAMLVASGCDVPVACAAARVQGAHALAGMGCDCIVMDDGFAHRALGRHLDVVVLRGDAPLGNGHLLPWGTLREPPSSLRRADVIWLHHKQEGIAGAGVEDVSWHRFCPQAAVVRSQTHYRLVCDAASGRPPPRRLVAASGIARPEAFHAALGGMGVDVPRACVFADHHRYHVRDVNMLAYAVTQCRADGLVVTAKDAVKLRELWPSPQSLFVLHADIQIVEGMTHFVTRLKGVLKQ